MKLFDDVSENKIRTDDEKFQGPPVKPKNFTFFRPGGNLQAPSPFPSPLSADEPRQNPLGVPGNQRVLKKAPPTRARDIKRRALR